MSEKDKDLIEEMKRQAERLEKNAEREEEIAQEEREEARKLRAELEELEHDVSEPKPYFFYLERKIEAPKERMTGKEIKLAIKAVVPEFDLQHELVLEGDPDEVIPDDKVVDLDPKHGGAKHFFSRPPTNFGFQ